MKRILYQNDALLTVYHVNKGQLHRLHTLQATDETDLHIFADYLTSDKKTPIFWLIDTAIEEYQQVWQPHVLGQERKALLKHRLRRLFEPTAYTHTVFQGRSKEGRGDDKFLFLAINNAEELLQPWLSAIIESGVLLQAIYSLPLLSEVLLRHLPQYTYTLLVSQALQAPFSTTESVRQSFFLNGQLQFSRLTPLTTHHPNKYAEHLITQIIRTERYLSTTRTMISGQNLNVLILSASPYFDYLAEYLDNNRNDNLPIQLIDTAEFADHLAISTQHRPQPIHLHHLLMHLLSKQRINNHYGRKPERRYYHHQQISYGLYGVSAGLVGLGLLLGVKLLHDTDIVEQSIEQIKQDQFIIKNEMAEQDAKAFELSDMDLLAIQSVNNVGMALQQQHHWPNLPLRRISQIFSNPIYDDFMLKSLTWQVVVLQNANSNDEAVTIPQQSIVLDRQQIFIERLNLKGMVYLVSDAYIDALRKFSNLQNELRIYGGTRWKVNVIEQPENQNIGGFSTFELEIIIEHSNESNA